MKAAPAKPYKGMGMEGFIARWYARTTLNDLSQFQTEAKQTAAGLRPGADVLEVAPGPGYFAIALARAGDFDVTGLDISHTFVDIATQNAAREGAAARFLHGDVSAMPFPDNSFDFIYCRAAFKNFSRPLAAIDEMHRVLRPGGKARIIDLRKDVSRDEIDSFVKNSGRGPFDSWLTGFTFRHLLIPRALSQADFLKLAGDSRFGNCRIESGSIGFNVELMKEEPVSAVI